MNVSTTRSMLSGLFWFGREASILAVIAAMTFGICWLWRLGWSDVEIDDVSEPEILNLHVESERAEPTGISVWVSGEINGEADVWAGNWKPERLHGKVNFHVYHDWFQRECELHYEPIDATSGKLVIYYEFH
jgi:hypothetical protein